VGFHVIDATGSIEEQQQQMRKIVLQELGDSLRNGVMRASQGDIDAGSSSRSNLIANLSPGRSGGTARQTDRDRRPDAVGRSTQVSRLRTWLEHEGHAVLNTGFSARRAGRQGNQQAKEGNLLGPITMTLFYATDFADRLENEIVPALRAGFVVLTDRYIFSLRGARHRPG